MPFSHVTVPAPSALESAAPTEPPLGVLGGMGPAATADFLMRLARLTPAERDQDHLSTIVYSDPQTPDRSDAILGMGPSPLSALLRGVEFLNRAGCALIAIPCNTAHYWYDELAASSSVPIVHIVDTTAERIRAQGDAGTLGVLATDGTLRSGVYQQRLAVQGFDARDLADKLEPNPVMEGIRALKAGDGAAARNLLLSAGEELVGMGADCLLVGCTDISVALASVTEIAGRPVVDASDCLALACLAKLGRGSLASA